MKKYKELIFTSHALARLSERGISQGDAWLTWRSPDQSRYAEAKGAWVYFKTFGNQKIEVVAKKNDRGEWIVLSVWSRPVYEKQRQGFLLKLLRKIFSV
jgi:hypothetical protein